MLPSPRTSDTNGPGLHGDGGMDLRTAVAEIPLLPTPAAKEPGGTAEQYRQRLRDHDGREGSFLPLSMVVQLLPTPTARDSHNAGDPDRTDARMAERAQPLSEIAVNAQWGEYEPAIRRWESVTRPAPEPTKLNGKGNPKLSDEFDEWLMGYPAGWITEVPGVTWNEALKACGNGVVPQQGAAAVRWLLAMAVAA